MPELGDRSRAIGPQPLGQRSAPPPAMLAAADRILDLLAQRDRAMLNGMVVEKAAAELAALIDSIPPAAYVSHRIVAHAKANDHYYVKARLFGETAEPFTLQLRLGARGGRWLIWEALNLTGGRTAWTRQG